MDNLQWKNCRADSLLTEFFSQNDLKQLTISTGILLGCPLLVLDDAFHVSSHFLPPDFFDHVFIDAIKLGEITYEASALISKSPSLRTGVSDFITLEDSDYRRRFAPLSCSGVKLGYLVCVDTDGHLEKISPDTWHIIEQIFSKQMFIDARQQDRPLETAEDILIHLLNGEFSSASRFHLQAEHTYLSDFHPFAFALIDLTSYCNICMGKRYLKREITALFPDSHPFLYRSNIFLFLHQPNDMDRFSSLAEEFQLKIVISDPIRDLFDLPSLYQTAYDSLTLITDEHFHGSRVCSVATLRTPLLIQSFNHRNDLIDPRLLQLAAHDQEKDTHYCETLYRYLTCARSLKKTCDLLFTHRNTVLYRIRRMQEEFSIPLDDPNAHSSLLLNVSIILFQTKGPDFFLNPLQGIEGSL